MQRVDSLPREPTNTLVGSRAIRENNITCEQLGIVPGEVRERRNATASAGIERGSDLFCRIVEFGQEAAGIS